MPLVRGVKPTPPTPPCQGGKTNPPYPPLSGGLLLRGGTFSTAPKNEGLLYNGVIPAHAGGNRKVEQSQGG